MGEKWVKIPDFPSYAVSDQGRVQNLRRDSLVTIKTGKAGTQVVGLFSSGKHTTRSVPLLVAEAFVDRPENRFDTPILLDGDKTNCSAANILWRPRPFARVFSSQFSVPRFMHDETHLEVFDTREWFPSVKGPVTRFGLIFTAVLMSCYNRRPVFPTDQVYRFAKLSNY